MPLGLQNAFGLENAQQGLRQRIIDQLNLQKQKQEMQIADRRQALLEQEAQRHGQEFDQTLLERKAALAERSNAADVTNASKLAPELPMDQNVAPQAAGILDKGGLGGQLYTPPTQGETESGKPFVSTEQNPRMNLGTPGQQKEANDSAAIAAMANDPKTPEALRGFLRIRSALPKGENIPYQLITEPNGPQGASAKTANYTLKGKPIVGIEHNGKVMYQGQDVTDQVTPYVAPVQPTVINIPGVGPYSIDRGGGTGKPITGPDGNPIKTPDKPIPYQAAQNAASINTAEVEGVKVLRALHQSGLDESNDPLDPRWQNFVVTALKMAPEDFNKADIQQRTAFVNAALTRQLMGGRPSQYVAQLLQQHLPQGQMTGKQLHHVINNVLQQAGEQRTELTSMIPGIKGPSSGQGYQDFLTEVANSTNGDATSALAVLNARRKK